MCVCSSIGLENEIKQKNIVHVFQILLDTFP